MIKAGYIQFNPMLGEPLKNQIIIEKLLVKAADANLIVIPELANTGYNFNSRAQAWDLSEQVTKSRFVEFLEDKAKVNNQFIVSGFLERDHNKLYNTGILVGPKGYLGKYRKIHLFWNEFDFFEKGDIQPVSIDLGFCRIGILICFDWVFPELWRILGLKNVDLVCHPSNLVLPYAQQAVPVQALMNRYFVITANRYGTEREVTFSGNSFISGPKGQILKMAPPSKDDAAVIELDIREARNKSLTPRNHLFADRRPELYTDILSHE